LQPLIIGKGHNLILIDEHLIDQVKSFGFPETHIIKSLNQNDLNHSTITYYLLQKKDMRINQYDEAFRLE
jgi:hypothetical protein